MRGKRMVAQNLLVQAFRRGAVIMSAGVRAVCFIDRFHVVSYFCPRFKHTWQPSSDVCASARTTSSRGFLLRARPTPRWFGSIQFGALAPSVQRSEPYG